jgi:hypothetical protein
MRARIFARCLTRLQSGEIEALANLLNRAAEALTVEPIATA